MPQTYCRNSIRYNNNNPIKILSSALLKRTTSIIVRRGISRVATDIIIVENYKL